MSGPGAHLRRAFFKFVSGPGSSALCRGRGLSPHTLFVRSWHSFSVGARRCLCRAPELSVRICVGACQSFSAPRHSLSGSVSGPAVLSRDLCVGASLSGPGALVSGLALCVGARRFLGQALLFQDSLCRVSAVCGSRPGAFCQRRRSSIKAVLPEKENPAGRRRLRSSSAVLLQSGRLPATVPDLKFTTREGKSSRPPETVVPVQYYSCTTREGISSRLPETVVPV